jgi:hypothetical protein
MSSTKNIPPIVQLGAWLLSLIVFAVGFWHTHLGLQEMRPFGSEYGSLAIAAIVLLLLLITYYFAVVGNKIALAFYVFCGLFFFVFNMNYFYPSYLARKLVREEASCLYDTLQTYSSKSKRLLKNFGFKEDDSFSDFSKLKDLKDRIVTEIRKSGPGPNTRAYFAQFNKIISSDRYKIDPLQFMGEEGTKDKNDLANIYDGMCQRALQTLLQRKTASGGELGDAENFLLGVATFDSLQKKYTPLLKDTIIPDNSEILLEEVKQNKDIISLQKLASSMDEASMRINEASKKRNKLKKDEFTLIGETKSQNLGRIAHTVASVKERIDKVDTWSIIFICLFIDLLVPLAIYLLLRKKEDSSDKKVVNTKSRPNSF